MSELEDVEQLSGKYGSISRRTASDFTLARRSSSLESSQSGDEDLKQIQPNYLVDQALVQCKRFLNVYHIGIKWLGWTQLTKKNGWSARVIRWTWVLGWNLWLILTFTTSGLTCYNRNGFNPGKMVENKNITVREIRCSDTTVILLTALDVLILLTYWFGLILFSGKEREDQFNLAEKTFIKLTMNQEGSTKSVIRIIWAYCLSSLIWVILSICLRIMNVQALSLYSPETIIHWNYTILHDGKKIVLVTITFLGFTVYDWVYFMAITNYIGQSEMIIYLTYSVMELVRQKRHLSMDAAVKDICDIREKLHKLNGKTSTVAAMALINVTSNFIAAFVALVDSTSKDNSYGTHVGHKKLYLGIATAVLHLILWVVPLILPFIQAARVSHYCERLKQTGFYLRTRPFQYSKTPLPELDSYLAFTQAAKLRATLCGIPIYPWLLYAVLVFATVILLILFQMADFNITSYLNG